MKNLTDKITKDVWEDLCFMEKINLLKFDYFCGIDKAEDGGAKN